MLSGGIASDNMGIQGEFQVPVWSHYLNSCGWSCVNENISALADALLL